MRDVQIDLDSAGNASSNIIGEIKDLNISFTGFVLQNLPWAKYPKVRATNTKTQFKSMISSNIPGKKGRHGNARSVLCWEEKMAVIDENIVTEFLSQGHCGCNVTATAMTEFVTWDNLLL